MIIFNQQPERKKKDETKVNPNRLRREASIATGDEWTETDRRLDKLKRLLVGSIPAENTSASIYNLIASIHHNKAASCCLEPGVGFVR